MALLIPFSFSFSCPEGVNKWTLGLTNRYHFLTSCSVHIEDDNAGVILINAFLLIEGKQHKLGQPEGIFDGEGDNARSFDWTGKKPLSKILQNVLVIKHTNYSGAAINSIRVSGVLQR